MKPLSQSFEKMVSLTFSKGLQYNLTHTYLPLQRALSKAGSPRDAFCVTASSLGKVEGGALEFDQTFQPSSWPERGQPHLTPTRLLAFND